MLFRSVAVAGRVVEVVVGKVVAGKVVPNEVPLEIVGRKTGWLAFVAGNEVLEPNVVVAKGNAVPKVAVEVAGNTVPEAKG